MRRIGMDAMRFLGSTPGRGARMAAGGAMVAVGASARGRWWALSAAGAVPLLAGLLDVCVLGPLARRPWRGPAFRASCPPR